jgi:tetratricopeptide (TPR) repeat protein
LGEVDFVDGHPQRAIDRLEPALAALSSGDGDADTAMLAAHLGRYLALTGQEGALPRIEYSLGLAEKLDLRETLAEALINKALLLLRDDRLFEGRVLLEGAVELALANDLRRVALRAYNNLGVVLESSDRFVEGESTVARAIELARRNGDRGWESSLVGGSVITLVVLGRWDEAVARASEAEAIATTSFAKTLILAIVLVHCQRGQLDRARELFERYASDETEEFQAIVARDLTQAMLLFAEGRFQESLGAAEQALAAQEGLGRTSLLFKIVLEAVLEAALAVGDTTRAEELLASLDELRPGERTPLLRAQEARFRARLLAARGEASAERGFTTAHGIFRELETQPLLATTLLEHGEWLVSQDRAAEAGPLLDEAREIFERLEAAPWLDRLAEVTAEPTRSG